MPTLKLLPTRSRSLLIELKFFGEPFVFVVDTGAETTSIAQSLLNKILANVPQHEEFYKCIRQVEHHGVGGGSVTQRLPLKINFLGKQLNSISVAHFFDKWAKDPIHYYYPGERPHSGLLGNDVMMQFEQVVVNFQRREISFL